MRVAAIDIGTNTTLLLVAERDEQGRVVPLADRATITRLGQGVDRARALHPAAVERTLACLSRYAEELTAMGVEALDVVATSATRDAAEHGDPAARQFIERSREILGIAPRVVSGAEEASLAFAGGILGLELDGRVGVFDIGGGSTEVIVGTVRGGRGTVEHRMSLQVGSVRLFERLVRGDPPAADELATVAAEVDLALARVAPSPGAKWVGTAGTVTTVAAIARGIHPYEPARIHGMRLSAGEISATAKHLCTLPIASRRAIAELEPQRADVIPVGATILERIVAWTAAEEIIVSDRGLRWGLVMQLLEA